MQAPFIPPLPDEPPPPLPIGPSDQHGAVMQQQCLNGFAATGMQQWGQVGQVPLQQAQQQWGQGMGMQAHGLNMEQGIMAAQPQQQWGQQAGLGMGMPMTQQPQNMMTSGVMMGGQQWGQQLWNQQQWEGQHQMSMQQQGTMAQQGSMPHWSQQQMNAQQQGMMPQQGMVQQEVMQQYGMDPQQLHLQQLQHERQQALLQKQYQRQQEYQQMLMEKQQQQMQQMQQVHVQQQAMQAQQHMGYNQPGAGQWQQQQHMHGGGNHMWSGPHQMQQMPQPPPPPWPSTMQQPMQMQQPQAQPGMATADMAAPVAQPQVSPAAAPTQQQLVPPAESPAAAAALEPPLPVDLRQLLLPPGRYKRPKRLLLLLRGLPGSGKSHIAKAIRAKELEHSGSAPRVHSIDDYFMVDVEREVAADGSVINPTSSSAGAAGGVRRQGSGGSKRRVVTEQEYQHDPVTEASYWKSLLRALSKTLSSGEHSLVVLDAPAPKADQVKEAWMAGQSEGYEVMVVQPLSMDPQVCFKQNIHGRSLADIQAMAAAFEPPPSMYTQVTAADLFKEEGKGDAPISDVDMVVDDVEQTGSGAKAPAAVPAGSPAKQQHKQKSSRWEDEDDAAAAVGDSAGTHVSEPEAGRSTAAEQSKGPGSTAHADSDGDEAAAAGTAGGNSRPKKKPKLSVQMNLDIDHEALLAGVNQVLEQLDSEDAVGLSSTPGSARARAAAIAAAGGDAVDDDVGLGDRAAAGRGAGSSMSIGGSYSSTGGKGGILKSASTPGSSKKKVRWPDDVPQEAELDRPSAGFSIARQRRQLVEVFWVDGLGPKGWVDEEDEEAAAATARVGGQAASGAQQVQKHLGHHTNHNSFADQVRAEHRSEHDAFRAILLGHGPTAAGPQRQR